MSEETKRSGGGPLLPLMSSSEDRKSSSGSNPGKKVIIKSADMKEDVQKEAVDIAIAAFEKYNVEKDVAEHIKKMFDKKYGPTWHCIVGKNFARSASLMAYSSIIAQYKRSYLELGLNLSR